MKKLIWTRSIRRLFAIGLFLSMAQGAWMGAKAAGPEGPVERPESNLSQPPEAEGDDTITVPVAFAAENGIAGESRAATVAPDVEYRTAAQIRDYVRKNPITYEPPVYTVQPVMTAPHNPGQIDVESMQDGLRAINTVRYIAGLSDNVVQDDELSRKIQAGALINAIHGELNHHPGKPEGMTEELYQLGYSGTSTSNIAYGFGNFAGSVLRGYMEDGDPGNIGTVGHRRWILNPRLGRVGFGMVDIFSGIAVFDSSGSSAGTVSMWPAQNMPVQFFGGDYPWSFSTGNNETLSDIRVTLKNQNTGTVWSFPSSDEKDAFYVDNGGYGLRGCIIFRPDSVTEYLGGEKYSVTIEGTSLGTIQYDVNFFNLYERPITAINVRDQGKVAVGATVQMEAEMRPADTDEPVTWGIFSTYSNQADITVDGLLTIKDYGDGAIWGYCENASGSIRQTFRVKTYIPVESVTVTPSSVTIMDGDSTVLKETVFPENATTKTVTWSSSDPSVVTVGRDGTVTAGKPGTAVITVQTDEGSKKATCEVTVTPRPVAGVSLNTGNAQIEAGKTLQLIHEVTPFNATNKEVSWTSSNAAVATVSPSGLVTGVKAGTATITVTTADAGKTATCIITVTATGAWKKSNGKYWYLRNDGTYPSGQWEEISGKWYYFDKSGYMVTGWKKINKKWYYFGGKKDGAMKTGWVKSSKKWYYLDQKSGAMKTGWLLDGGKWYYLDAKKGGAMKTGWLKSGGKWYYMDGKGRMLANTSRKIGRKTYQFNKKGVCTNP